MRIPITVGLLTCLSLGFLQAQVAVPMSQYEPGRTNTNLAEFTLTPEALANGAFGKLFSRTVDDGVYALPLIVPNLVMGGGVTSANGKGRKKPAPGPTPRDVMFVATMANTVYAYDATDPSATNPIWSRTLGPALPTTGTWWGSSHFGVMGTPAADLETKTLYMVAKIQNSSEDVGLYLFAIDMISGNTKFGAPRRLTFADDTGEIIHVPDAIQRAGILLDRGVVYVAVANVFPPDLSTLYQEGYVQSFDAQDLTRLGSLQVTPNTAYHGKGGVWQAGRGLAADSAGNVYVATAGGHYDGLNDWGGSILKLAPQDSVGRGLVYAEQLGVLVGREPGSKR